MDDPRLNEAHLRFPRRRAYVQAREELCGALGFATRDVEQDFQARRLPLGFVPAPARRALQDVLSGKLYPLRVGINTIGRHPENDIVLNDRVISRRHCVILVHASGLCEVHDTASRNGTRLEGRTLSRAVVHPGDVIQLCDWRLLYVAITTDESQPCAVAWNDTVVMPGE